MEETSIWSSISKNFQENKKALFRLWIILSLTHLTGFLLGFGVWLIIFGVQIMVPKIIIHWAPAREWLIEKIGLTFHQPQSKSLSPLSLWFTRIVRLITILVPIAIGAYVISLGVDIIAKDGFLNQNFIYLIFSTNQ